MGTADKRRPCCFCGNLLSWTDVDELPDRTVRCQDKIPCRDRHNQRIADLEAEIKKILGPYEDIVRQARVDALRECHNEGWLRHALGCSGGLMVDEQRSRKLCKCALYEILDEIAQEQRAPAPRVVK